MEINSILRKLVFTNNGSFKTNKFFFLIELAAIPLLSIFKAAATYFHETLKRFLNMPQLEGIALLQDSQ